MKITKMPVHLNRDEFLTPFDRLFDNIVHTQFPSFEKEFGISFEKGAFPKVDVVDYDDCIVIVAEIPALSKKNISIDVEDGVLSIAGDKHQLSEPNARYIRRELKQSSFRRSFQLGESLDSENIVANFNEGVLRLEIPKREPVKKEKQSIKID